MPNARNTRNSRASSAAQAPTGGVATLVARGVTKHHGAQTVLETVGLSVGAETRLGVLGPNGVGKTTLLRILAGLDQPDKGRVTLLPPTATVGYLAHEREAVEGETVADYLARCAGPNWKADLSQSSMKRDSSVLSAVAASCWSQSTGN